MLAITNQKSKEYSAFLYQKEYFGHSFTTTFQEFINLKMPESSRLYKNKDRRTVIKQTIDHDFIKK
jgi:ABC-type Mn2+/Zn2+ transport system ATPase subunit